MSHLPAGPTANFEPTQKAATQRLLAVRPSDYARTRNTLTGAVTQLSPYITHGLLRVPQVLAHLHHEHGIGMPHKLFFELGWREYFRHVWQHEGQAILHSLHPGPLPDAAYAHRLPEDIAQGRTGWPVVDQAVHRLYETGWLHNHARMWLASYVVHLRKVHWRVGADWMHGHLLDGDLASNHLSWQWVAGTASHKPYLFNAENVRRYAPPAWHSHGGALDTSYEALEAIARDPKASLPGPAQSGMALGGQAPVLYTHPLQPATTPHAQAADTNAGFSAANAQVIAGKDVHLVHAWSLGGATLAHPNNAFGQGCAAAQRRITVAICDRAFHTRWAWSAKRWQFVSQGLSAIADVCWFDSAQNIMKALARARSVRGIHDPHLGDAFAALKLQAAPRAFSEPGSRCPSFCAWWARTRWLGAEAAGEKSDA